jgi:hypothetical protein
VPHRLSVVFVNTGTTESHVHLNFWAVEDGGLPPRC